MTTTPFPIRLAGLGYYLPAQRLASTELERSMNIPAGWIERATGVCGRRRIEHETTASMGADATRMALDTAGLTTADLDAIVGACTAPHQAIPCTAAIVQRMLRSARRQERLL